MSNAYIWTIIMCVGSLLACYKLPLYGASCNMHDHRDGLNVLFHMHYNYTWVSWNIQRRLFSIFKTLKPGYIEFGVVCIESAIVLCFLWPLVHS